MAFALPRRDVCVELSNRLKNIFANNNVISVYGGHTSIKEGDIVVLTTHQLYRYKKYFSLIILDEIDAFPFKGDKVLNSMFEEALCGHFIMMSATPPKETIEYFSQDGKDILRLDTRFHKHALPVPKIINGPTPYLFLKLVFILKSYIKSKKPVFIFAPTIEECEKLYAYLSIFIKGGNCVHSKKKYRSEIIDAFRSKSFNYLVTTSVLERGVTLRDLQVIVYKSDSFVYDSGTLVQISGRVGRKADAPEGEVIYLAKTTTKDMEESIRNIKKSNEALQTMLQRN